MVPGAAADVNTTLPLVLNIVGLVLFCFTPVLVAVPGLVLAMMAGKAKKTGDMETAKSKAKISLILAVVSIALGIVVFTAGAIYWLGTSSAPKPDPAT